MPFPRAVLLAALVLPAAALAAERQALSVAVAANARPALAAIARAFEAERPDVEVRLSFGASGTFFAQIGQGAPFDLFFSADREYPQKLVAAGLGEAEVIYAVGRLVLWIPRGSRLDAEKDGLAALARPEVRKVAIASPALAPYGRAAIAALRQAGVLAAVEPKLVSGENVAQAAQFAESGAADAAFLPLSLAREPALDRAGKAVPVSAAGLEQAAVVLAGARARDLARSFLAFATGEKGRAILAEAGYGLP